MSKPTSAHEHGCWLSYQAQLTTLHGLDRCKATVTTTSFVIVWLCDRTVPHLPGCLPTPAHTGTQTETHLHIIENSMLFPIHSSELSEVTETELQHRSNQITHGSTSTYVHVTLPGNTQRRTRDTVMPSQSLHSVRAPTWLCRKTTIVSLLDFTTLLENASPTSFELAQRGSIPLRSLWRYGGEDNSTNNERNRRAMT